MNTRGRTASVIPPPPPELEEVKATRAEAPQEAVPKAKKKHEQKSPPYRYQAGRVAPRVRRVVLIMFLIFLLIILVSPQLRDPFLRWLNPLSYRGFPESIDFEVERTISLSSVRIYTVDVPRPLDLLSGAQRVYDVSSNPPYTPEEKYNQTWMVWDGDGEARIQVHYRMRTRTLWWQIDPEDALSVKEAMLLDSTYRSLADRYNHDEWRIQYSNTTIPNITSQITSSSWTVLEDLKAIYDFIHEEVVYNSVRGKEVKTPVETLRDGEGDCDDMSFLLAAMLRSIDIPSWVELGAMHESLGERWVGHAWLEVYLPTRKGGVNVTIDMANSEFLVRGANRFSEWESDGVGEHLEDYYYAYSYVSDGGSAAIEDDYVTLSYNPSGTVLVRLGSDGGKIPCSDVAVFLIIAPVVAAIRRNQTKR